MRANQVVLSDAAKNAIKALRTAKPWAGTFEERLAKYATFAAAFGDACGLECSFEFIGEEMPDAANRLGLGGFHAESNKVWLARKLSVVTLLWAFGLAVGLGRYEALPWAKGLFRHYFPRSARACVEVNGLMRRRSEADAVEDGGDEEE